MLGDRLKIVTIQATVLAILGLASPLEAAIVYKNPSNPTGIPDFTQEAVPGVPKDLDNAICLAAAAGDALWYFDQLTIGGARKFPGLVEHSDKPVPPAPQDPRKNWGGDGYRLVAQLADQIYVKNKDADWGVLRYIYSKRGAQDITEETKTYRRGNTEIKQTLKVWNWGITDYSGAQVNNQLINQASTPNTLQVGIIGAQWHDQTQPATQFMQAMNGKGELIDETIGHHFVIAGRDDQEKQLVVAHGWGDHWKDVANANFPVRDSYYNLYDYKIQDGRMRITDKDELVDRVGGLGGRTPDYAEVDNIRILDAATKVKFNVDAFKKLSEPMLASSSSVAQALAHFEFLTYNASKEDRINRLGLELPLLNPSSFSIGNVSNPVLPTGWTYRVWDPNVDKAAHEMVTDQGILNWLGYDFRGLLFESTLDLLPDMGLDVAFDLPADLLDWSASGVLNAAAWNVAGDVRYVGLAVNIATVDEPSSMHLVALVILLLSSVSRKKRNNLKRAHRPVAPLH